MKSMQEICDNPLVTVRQTGEDGGRGWVKLGRSLAGAAYVVWSFGGGWDHVSVSYRDRCPTWDEMCKVKDIFFQADECCVEYHPPKKDYVNVYPYCLHIWRPQDAAIPTPPKIFV